MFRCNQIHTFHYVCICGIMYVIVEEMYVKVEKKYLEVEEYILPLL